MEQLDQKLFKNPRVNLSPTNGSIDGTFLHQDIVFQSIVKNSTPWHVYTENREFIESFVETLINYSPISINISDYWNKHTLSQVVIPLENDKEFIFKRLNPNKILYDETGKPKAFFPNAMLELQERQAEMFMAGIYKAAVNTKYDHTLKIGLNRLYNNLGIDMSKDGQMFNNVNDIFNKERFLPFKEFNLKKGKVIPFKHILKSAWDGELEGKLKDSGFFMEYEKIDTFKYKIDSVILPDVYESFVKPLCHPLGMNGDYKKVCLQEMSDNVFGKLVWRADAVTVRCSNPSDTSPLLPPPMQQVIKENPNYDPSRPVTDTNDPWITDKTTPRWWKCVQENKEKITKNQDIDTPNDPRNPIPNLPIATFDGFNLWEDIKNWDEGQGNILIDVQKGYGNYEYSGYRYTKYIFENGAYLIEYSCQNADGTYERIIEYYRFDNYDISIHKNVIAVESLLPRWAYEKFKVTNMVNGYLSGFDPNDPHNTTPLYTIKWFSLEDTQLQPQPTNTAGLDLGFWGPVPNGVTFPSQNETRIALLGQNWKPLDTLVIYSVMQKTYVERIERTNQNIVIDFQTYFEPLTLDDFDVWVNGIKKPGLGDSTARGFDYDFKTRTLSVNDTGEVSITALKRTQGTNIIVTSQQKTYLQNSTNNILVFEDGKLLSEKEVYIIPNYNGTTETLVDIQKPIQGLVEIYEYPHSVVVVNDRISPDFVAGSNNYEFSIDTKSDDALVFTQGKLLYPGIDDPNHNIFPDWYYTFRYEKNQWTLWNAHIDWTTDTNIINTIKRIIPVETLVARWVENRGCIVNTFNLRQEDNTSIREDFQIRVIDYQRNVINTIKDEWLQPIDDFNIVNEENNILNQHQPYRSL